jgi:TatD DNase family protein
MELIDTHCHLTFESAAGGAGDIDSVLQRSIEAGVTGWITVGTDLNENKKALEFAEKFDNLYAAVGIHPHESKKVSDLDIEELKRSAKHPKVVAIGETGLDYHYDFSPPADQARLFNAQLQIAAELNLPVIIHSREAFDDTINILERYVGKLNKVVFHCFSYSPEQAKIILDNGYFLSFTGVVTFKGATLTKEAAKIVPLDRLMIETDCPYMTPEPKRKQKINEPAFLIHTAKFLAELRQIPLEDFANAVTSTSRSFFSLPQK